MRRRSRRSRPLRLQPYGACSIGVCNATRPSDYAISVMPGSNWTRPESNRPCLQPAGHDRYQERPRSLRRLVAVLAAGAVWLLKPDASPPLRKLELSLPATGVVLGTVQLSPDGSRVAYVAGDHLFVRRLDDLAPQDLGSVPPGTEVLAWSPDATTMAFASTDGKIRKIAATRGQPLVVSDLPDTRRAIGLVWQGGDIIAAVWRSGLYRVDARGGTMAPWLNLNAATEVDFHALVSLPDGRVVFATHRQNNDYVIESFDGTNRVLLHPPTLVASLAYSPTGHLLVVKGGHNAGLWAMRLSRDGLDADSALQLAAEADWVSASAGATMVFAATHSAGNAFELVAVNRAGRDVRVLKPSAPIMSSPTVSPDGRRLVFVQGAHDRTNMPTGLSKRSVWVHQVEPPADIRLTPEERDYGMPAWFSSGDRVLITEALSPVGRYRLIALAPDGSGTQSQLADGCCAQMTPDGSRLLFALEDRGTLRLRHAALGANGLAETAQRIFASDPEPNVCCFDRFALAPSGRLLAYVDVNDSGTATLLLSRFPGGEGRWHVATADGQDAISGLRWSRKTNELLFLKTDANPTHAQLLSVAVNDGPSVTVGNPALLFDVPLADVPGGYDVSPDGRTLYLARRAPVRTDQPTMQRYVLIQNWIAELDRPR